MTDQLPSLLEDHISPIPALQLLQNLGNSYLTPAETVSLRNGKMSGVILDGVLILRLRKLNKIRFKGGKHEFRTGTRLWKPDPGLRSQDSLRPGLEERADAAADDGACSDSSSVLGFPFNH